MTSRSKPPGWPDSSYITKDGDLGIDCGGDVIVMPLREWHKLAKTLCTARPDEEALQAVPHLRDKKALVLYFETDQDRDGFEAIVIEHYGIKRTEKLQ